MHLTPLTFPHKEGQAFRHVDGGYYQFICSAYSSEDQSEKVVYKHVWPFTPSVWERPVAEFVAKFSPITQEELDAARTNNKEAAQKEIAAAKAHRRAHAK